MSFQGDVGGIGLAELLQSLARGRREGVLTLNTGKGHVCTLGLEAGVLYLLPEPGEDASIWKDRARQAWVDHLDHRMDAVRTSEIARAHRIERLYQLLDSEGVHFRFDQRALPGRSEGPLELTAQEAESAVPQVGAPRTPQVYCEGVSVEFLLLEYARLSDEAESFQGRFGVVDDDVPVAISETAAQATEGPLAECDGRSTVAEIADRLAVPIRQARQMIADMLRQAHLGLASPSALLELAGEELREGRVQRAGARLAAWVRSSPPGPCTATEAELIETEWREDRLAPVLNRMPTRLVRRMLRRVDHALEDPKSTLRHWRELQRLRRHDGLIELHRIACEVRLSPEEDTPSLRELLEVARGFRELGRPRRAASILRIAAARNPTSNSARLDIGVGLVAAGMVEDGTPWILETARALIEGGSPEKALAPLRQLIELAPDRRDARRLVIRARNITVRRELIRRHSAVGLAVLVALALGAWVQIHVERRTDRQYEEVAARLEDPVAAQELFDRYFGDSDSARASALGALIRDRRRQIETGLRTEWYEGYREAQRECMFGDATTGLARALQIPNPPVLVTVTEPWPLVADLFNGLAARLEGELRDLGEPELDAPRQVQAEEALAAQGKALLAQLQGSARVSLVDGLKARLEALLEELERRAHERKQAGDERDRTETYELLGVLLNSARAHAKAGAIQRALIVFDKLFESDPTGKMREMLHEEYEALRLAHEAEQRGRELATEGRHEEARELIREHVQRIEAVSLPWQLETYPPGAIATLEDGTKKITPFELESPIDKPLSLRLELSGYEPATLQVDQPSDQFVWLSRQPERRWAAGGRVEALPVAVGADHIVCDRTGRIARLSATGQVRWERQLGGLGGVARAPVFLSQRSGHLLLLTEDGEAWIVDARSGDLEGPIELGSGPKLGPTPTAEGARATLRDGRTAVWSERVKPDQIEEVGAAAGGETVRESREFTAGLDVLRAPASGRVALESRFNDWVVEVRDEVFLAHRGKPEVDGFAVRRTDGWNFLAWEAPNATLPQGRLWISDGAGLRSFVP